MSLPYLGPKNRIRGEQGASAVEFALVLPILLVVIFAIIQFGILFHTYLELTHAAREGVRWAALELPASDVIAKTKAAAPNILLLDTDITVEPETRTINQQGDPATVSISHTVPIDIPLMSSLLGDTYIVTAKAVQRIE